MARSKTVSKHGNITEILGKMMNLGRGIEITCRKADRLSIKLRQFRNQASRFNDYIECLEELMKTYQKEE